MGEQAFLICHHSNLELVRQINERLTLLVANQPVHLDMNNLFTMSVKDIMSQYMQEVAGRDFNFRNRQEHTALAVACLRHSALGMMTILTGYIMTMYETGEEENATLGVAEPDATSYSGRGNEGPDENEEETTRLTEEIETSLSTTESEQPEDEETTIARVDSDTSGKEEADASNATEETSQSTEETAKKTERRATPKRRLLGIRRG